MKKLLSILFFLPLFLSAQTRIAITSQPINGQTATSIATRVIMYPMNGDSLQIYYAYYTAAGTQVKEGNVTVANTLDNTTRTSLLSSITSGAGETVTSPVLSIWDLYDGSYHYRYSGPTDKKAKRISASTVSTANSDAIKASIFSALGAADAESPLRVIKQAVPWGADTATDNQRTPNITFLQKNGSGNYESLLTFAQRHTGGAADAQGMRLCTRVVTYNPTTKTITVDTTVIVDEPTNWHQALGFSGNPMTLLLTTGANAGKVLLFIDRNTNGTGLSTNFAHSIFLRVANNITDAKAGIWSSAVQLVSGTFALGHALPGNGDAVQIPAGPYQGRILVPEYYNDQFILYTDSTNLLTPSNWHLTSRINTNTPSQGSEQSLAWSWADSSLIMTVRSDSTGSTTRYQAKSYNGGTTWTTLQHHSDLVGGNSNASSVQRFASGVSGSQTFLSGPTSTAANMRYKGRIRITTNGGTAWPTAYKPIPELQNYGYSSIDRLSNNLFIVAVESNSNAGGGFNLDEHIKVLVFNQGEIDNQVSPTTPATVSGVQTLYSAYKTRVVADGGSVTDSAATVAALQWALNYGVTASSTLAYSARWGVKTSGSTITKIYGLFGSDMTVSSGGSFAVDNTLAYARIKVNSGNTGRLQSASFTPLTGKRFAFGYSSLLPLDATFRVGVDDGTSTSPLQIQTINPTTGTKFMQAGFRDSTGIDAALKTVNYYSDNAGYVLFGDKAGGVISLMEDGVDLSSSNYNALTPKSGVLASFDTMSAVLMLGARKDAGTYYSATAGFFNEVWWLPDASEQQAKALSTRLAIYKTL